MKCKCLDRRDGGWHQRRIKLDEKAFFCCIQLAASSPIGNSFLGKREKVKVGVNEQAMFGIGELAAVGCGLCSLAVGHRFDSDCDPTWDGGFKRDR